MLRGMPNGAVVAPLAVGKVSDKDLTSNFLNLLSKSDWLKRSSHAVDTNRPQERP